ncbi:MAG: peptidase domain-containing ABC transporter, partial [Flavobacteriales bacterium]|nr:peptidase domain-containing ABC transporter [Flavobacteriales bacterium]
MKIIAKYYKKVIVVQQIRSLSETTRVGSTLLGISDAVEKIGFRSLGVKLNLKKLSETPLPCILHWNKVHFVVLYKIKSTDVSPIGGNAKGKGGFYISDPAHGLLTYTRKEFLKSWIGNNADENTEEGIALLLEPTPKFYDTNFDDQKKAFGFQFLFKYLFKYKQFLWQLVIGLLAGSLLQLIVPFLTQSVVDVGIKNLDVHFIYLILFAQLALFIGRTSIEVIRSWILLHLSTRINISLVSDFFIKLMDLPIAFFDTRMTGDILQRINDHRRIERILTTSSLNGLFSMVNLIVFSLVLLYYNLTIFGIFIMGSLFY